jgi:hypothetical protein
MLDSLVDRRVVQGYSFKLYHVDSRFLSLPGFLAFVREFDLAVSSVVSYLAASETCIVVIAFSSLFGPLVSLILWFLRLLLSWLLSLCFPLSGHVDPVNVHWIAWP